MLVLDDRTGEIAINFDYKIALMIREAECMSELALPSPPLTNLLLKKNQHFVVLQSLLKVHNAYICYVMTVMEIASIMSYNVYIIFILNTLCGWHQTAPIIFFKTI